MNTTDSNSSDLKQLLTKAHQGEIEIEAFMSQFLTAQIFMPVTDPDNDGQNTPVGFQKSDKAKPLTLETEEGFSVMVIFSDPQQSKEFIKNYPEYDGGFIAEVPWMLERLGEGMGVSLNPDAEEGIDFDPETIRQLLTLHQRNQ
ncbi:MAG: SseB family protein [Gammaproteobacteria bacterium]|jgi:hypothetical protein|nr:SseB family protein [Gammaproteobacteria bacterium]MBT3489256.1 SseB family protein [Gammaproteobacteria bacterium]MBT3717794.1 SseB family protein [Gammaproteobacteria bacterium]MBT3843604.1 SseB family protein [Gammaproteobacteria bacterium]MBT3894040.1 SseB family protein [Gammaproteobacteria bacterium]